ncbi:hypothetical protein [Sphingomonas sp. Leaf339]|uniref:hypothetical protein n=1 Tax=Sphingomonas sp. Leaf339 TaxID=1736343 RepID=UPI000B13DF39|nr:hypothetical protein [Sphingomonas sp. Leaf339]
MMAFSALSAEREGVPPVVVCTYEDRESALPGLALLARSIANHAPHLRLLCFSSLAGAKALSDELPGMELRPVEDLGVSGWSVKPTVLLHALEESDSALWLDTDVVVSGGLGKLLDALPAGAVVVGEEYRYRQLGGCSARARAWGLTVSRELDCMTNSGSVRVTKAHRPLLERWQALLADPRFVAAQQMPIATRPTHLLGDQDVLAALLVSTEFADLPVHYIRNGPEMVQHCGANGYHVIDRLRMIFRRPAFVHMLGRYKPWSFDVPPDPLRSKADYLHFVCFELSPFHAAAQPYAAALGNPTWLQRRSRLARVLNAMALGNVALRGLPLALAAWAAEWKRGSPPPLSCATEPLASLQRQEMSLRSRVAE